LSALLLSLISFYEVRGCIVNTRDRLRCARVRRRKAARLRHGAALVDDGVAFGRRLSLPVRLYDAYRVDNLASHTPSLFGEWRSRQCSGPATKWFLPFYTLASERADRRTTPRLFGRASTRLVAGRLLSARDGRRGRRRNSRGGNRGRFCAADEEGVEGGHVGGRGLVFCSGAWRGAG
jgi:hypothetical protein